MRRGGCRHGSGVLPVRGSDRWAAAGMHTWWPTRWSCGHSAVSDAAGKAVPAGVAGQALPEPYVPGSGDRVPAELRLVLAGYAGIAGGLFAGALACATALVFFFFIYDIDQLDRYSGLYDLLFFLALLAFLGGLSRGLGLGLGRVFTRSGRVSDFPLCCGGAAIHVRPR